MSVLHWLLGPAGQQTLPPDERQGLEAAGAQGAGGPAGAPWSRIWVGKAGAPLPKSAPSRVGTVVPKSAAGLGRQTGPYLLSRGSLGLAGWKLSAPPATDGSQTCLGPLSSWHPASWLGSCPSPAPTRLARCCWGSGSAIGHHSVFVGSTPRGLFPHCPWAVEVTAHPSVRPLPPSATRGPRDCFRPSLEIRRTSICKCIVHRQ